MRYGIAMRLNGFLACFALLGLLLVAAPAPAQLQELDGLLSGGGAPASGEKLKVTASIAPATDTLPALLAVTAEVQPGWHIYSITQPKGGPLRTQIAVDETSGVKLLGDFIADPPAESHKDDIWGDLTVESHAGKVMWIAPIELPADADLASLAIRGSVTAQACDANNCLLPKKYPFEAKLGEPLVLGEAAKVAFAKEAESAVAEAAPATPGLPPDLTESTDDYRASGSHVIWRGTVTSASPGGEAIVHVSAQAVEEFHLYGYEPKDPRTPLASKPTLMLLTDHPDWTVTGPTASAEPGTHMTEDRRLERYYEQPIAWTFRLQVPEDAKPGKFPITGMIGYQACRSGENGVCDMPLAAQFNGTIEIAADGSASISPLRFAKAPSYNEVSKIADAASEVVRAPSVEQSPTASAAPASASAPAVIDDPTNLPFLSAIGFGFLGGLILNLMPCVLPVIGLKVLSFIEQSGKDRGHVFMLNLVYSLGIISVFAVLAALLTVFQLGWGEQSSYAGFNIPMTAIIFVMALSFLGVWEIPIPGFVGGSSATALARREGWTGTFTKGVLTTLLATPCSGPGLGTALAWCAGKPAPMIYAVFISMGLGMASPYLLIGAFPGLVRFLPKPGAWMETFKQLMGFVLLGTVVFMLSVLRPTYVVPSIALLFGLWFACWWIGRMPYTATGAQKAKGWAQAIAAVGVVYLIAFVGWEGWTPKSVSFVGLHNFMEYKQERRIEQLLAQRADGSFEIKRVTDATAEIPWNPFTPAIFSSLVEQKQPVLVDFTADWCGTCKTLEKLVLNTDEVRAAMKQGNVVPVQADMTEPFPAASEALAELKANGIPVVAIYAPGSTTPSTVFRGMFTQAQLLEALAKVSDATERTAALQK
jgi:suppressor for copper-sensitivity B